VNRRQRHEEHRPNRTAGGGLDPLSLVVGLLALLVSAYVLTDGGGWITAIDPLWALAGAAVLTGLLLLGASVRRGRD